MVKRSRSITTIYLIHMVVLAVVSISIIGYFWVTREYEQFRTESREFREAFIENQKGLIRNGVEKVIDYMDYQRSQAEERLRQRIRSRVYEAHAVAAHIYATHRDSSSKDAIGRMIKDALRPMRFNNGRGYYFIVSLDGEGELYPAMPSYEHRNLLDLKDAQGNHVIRDEIDVIRTRGEGFLVDCRTKPGTGSRMIYPKATFVKAFEPLGWYIGTGEYLDDLRADIEQEVFRYVDNLRFGEQDVGYVFVVRLHDINGGPAYGVMEVNRNDPALVGRLLSAEERDARGRYFVKEYLQKLRTAGEGFVSYSHRKAFREKAQEKISFFKLYRPWGLVVGAGFYLDDIERHIELRKINLEKRIATNMFGIGVIMVAILCIIYIVARYLSTRIAGSFNALTDFFRTAATESVTIGTDELEILEFQKLARSANIMITKRNKAEAALRESEATARALLNAPTDDALLLAPDGTIISLNQSAAGRLGKEDRHLAGTRLDEHVDSDIAGSLRQWMDGVIGSRLPVRFEQTFAERVRDTSIYPIMDPAGWVAAVAFYSRDITYLKRTEQELRLHRRHLELINKILRHDLINNLSVIRSALRLYRDEGDQDMLGEADRSVDKSVGLIRRMRELESFVLAHKELKVLDIKDSIEKVASTYPAAEITVQGKGLVLADESLESVIDNILKNAFLHGKAGRIVIEIDSADGFCHVRIADDGIGIPANVKDRVFEEGFAYGETAQTGLGMHIVRTAMERYGGFAVLEDNTPRGTVVILRFNILK